MEDSRQKSRSVQYKEAVGERFSNSLENFLNELKESYPARI